MRKNILKYFFFLLVAAYFICCKQVYTPPPIKGNVAFLVVDGVIVNGPDSTIIDLSRAQNINDSAYINTNFETGAAITIIGTNGDSYSLTEQSSGRYVTSQLVLNPNELYQLKIVRTNGNIYLSDSMPVKISPPIDSINWVQKNDGVTIFANTHDPQNNTRYYRWDYTETWEYHSGYDSYFDYTNGQVLYRDSSQHIYKCWHTQPSTNLIIASSIQLTSDVIYEQPLVFIPSTSEKLGVEYSIFVKQYALSKDAYDYWQILQKNTEQNGSLFDAQPSQLTGNIHNIANANEPVLGLVSISSVQQQRIFISNNDLPTWSYNPLSAQCTKIVVPNNPDSFAFYFGSGYIPISEDYPPSGFAGYYSAIEGCVDCTLEGGTTVKPLFWPY